MARPGGNPDFLRIRNFDTSASIRRRQEKADSHARTVAVGVQEFLEEGGCLKPYRALADWLNGHGYTTSRGYPWTGREVSRLVKRILRLRQSPASEGV